MVDIRPIVEEDAEAYLNLMISLDNETKFMLYEPDERKSTKDDMKERIARTKDSDSLLLGAYENDILIGFMSALRGATRRIKHTAYIVVGIIEAYQGRGIGKSFFEMLEKWAVDSGIKRLELTVMENNEKALSLYKSTGFNVEGIKEKAIFSCGTFVNEFYMAKIF